MRLPFSTTSWTILSFIFIQAVRTQDGLDEASSLAAEAESFIAFATAEVVSLYSELTSLIGATPTATTIVTTRTLSPSLTSSPSIHRIHSRHSSSMQVSTQVSSTPSISKSSATNSASQLSSTLAAVASASNVPRAQDIGNNLIAIIVGSVLGAVIIALLIIIALLCCRRRRNRREGGVTPTSEEIENWKRGHGHTGYAPVTEFGQGAAADAEKAMMTASAQPIAHMRDHHDEPFTPMPPPPRHVTPSGDNTGQLDQGIHPAYRTTGDQVPHGAYADARLARDPATGASDPVFGISSSRSGTGRQIDRKDIVERPVDMSSMRSGYNIRRKPVATQNTSDRSDDRTSHEGHRLLSPSNPDGTQVPSPLIGRQSQHFRNESRDALLADVDSDNIEHAEQNAPRDDNFNIRIPSSEQQHQYQAYQPGISASPHGPSPSHPAASFVAPYRNQDRDAPEVPQRSPARRSWDSVNSGSYRRKSTDTRDGSESDEIPMMWRKSSEQPRMPPKGVTYHDFVPIQRDRRTSNPPAAAMGATRTKSDVRRVSLNDLVEAERRKEDRRRRDASDQYHRIRPTYSEYAVGQAL